MEFKGKKFNVVDSTVFITASVVDYMYCDNIMLVRVFLSTNYPFGVHFNLKILSNDDITFYLCSGYGDYSHRIKLNMNNPDYLKILKLNLLSSPDPLDNFFVYTVDLLLQVLPDVVNLFLQKYLESVENFSNSNVVVL